VFGVAATLYDAARRSADAPPRSPVIVGLTAAVLATGLGNIAGGVQFLQDTSRPATYDWWLPSRVIEGTANEFPFFSFLLADLHAHMLVTPFALVVVAYAIQLALHGPPALAHARLSPRVGAELALAALLLGALYATNSFDYPTACATGVGALLLWVLAKPGRWRKALAWGVGWLVVSAILFLPFWLRFSPPADGLALVRDHVGFPRFARDYAFMVRWTSARSSSRIRSMHNGRRTTRRTVRETPPRSRENASCARSPETIANRKRPWIVT